MDVSEFIAYYKLKNTEKLATRICIFDQGDYYVSYDADAHFIAANIFRSTAVLKQLKSEAEFLDYVNINKNQFQEVISELLLVRQYTVEVLKFEKSTGAWVIVGQASPGRLVEFEEILFGSDLAYDSINTMALHLLHDSKTQSKMVALACVDTTKMQIHVAEFCDSDHLTNLAAAIVQLNPKECILPSADVAGQDGINLTNFLNRSKILVTERKRGEFSVENIVADLDRLLTRKTGEDRIVTALPQFSMQNAMGCAAALLKYLNLLNDSFNVGRYKLQTFAFDQFVRLDPPTIKALSLSRHISEDMVNCSNLHTRLNRCRTAMGQRLLEQWIRQPLLDRNRIDARLDIVESLVNNAEIRSELYEDLMRKLPNFQRVVKKLMRKSDVLQECYKTYQCIKLLPVIRKALDVLNCVAAKDLLSDPILEFERDFTKFTVMIEEVLDFKAAEQGIFIAKPALDEKMQELSESMTDIMSDMKQEHSKVARLLSLDPDKDLKLEHTNEDGYTFRLTRKMEKNLRQSKTFEVLGTLKSGIRFTNSALKLLNRNYQKAQKDYDECQEQLIEEVYKVALSYIGPLNSLSEVLASLDVLLSFAVVAATSTNFYVRPVVHKKGSCILRLRDSRHPCLETVDNLSLIPNDITFEDGVKLFFVSGPNMAGKSTYIRQIGMIVAMAQMGSFVPCSIAEISVVDAIFTRVGASDCIMNGVSTFMSEMIETAAILQNATENSLVIIDELGRGTSTYDGFGIAYAIAEHLATKVKCLTVFATHFYELTQMAKELSAVRNLHASVLTSSDQLTLLYKIMPGASDHSFGINVAEMVNFPVDVVEEARQRLTALQQGQAFQASSNFSQEEPSTEEQLAIAILRRMKELSSDEKTLNKLLELTNNAEVPSNANNLKQFLDEVINIDEL